MAYTNERLLKYGDAQLCAAADRSALAKGLDVELAKGSKARGRGAINQKNHLNHKNHSSD